MKILYIVICMDSKNNAFYWYWNAKIKKREDNKQMVFIITMWQKKMQLGGVKCTAQSYQQKDYVLFLKANQVKSCLHMFNFVFTQIDQYKIR